MNLENYKTLVKEMKMAQNKWKHISCLVIRRVNVVKMNIPPKAIYRFSEIQGFY